MALAAFCCGAEGFEDIEDWAKAQGQEDLRRDFGARLDNGIPHHDTFRRVLARLEPAALEAALHLVRQRLPCQLAERAQRHVALDGKELRGSHNALHQNQALLLLSAFATDQNLVIGQTKVDAKSNEIPAARQVRWRCLTSPEPPSPPTPCTAKPKRQRRFESAKPTTCWLSRTTSKVCMSL